jgi:hypothetical protein
LIDGSDYTVDCTDPAVQAVAKNFATLKDINVASAHRYAVDTFLEKPEVLIKKHKSQKFVDAKKFVRLLKWDDETQCLLIEMKFEDGATVGIQHVLRALYEIDVEFPVTRERQYCWRNGLKQSPLVTPGPSPAICTVGF